MTSRRKSKAAARGEGADVVPWDVPWDAIASGVLVAIVVEFMISLAGLGILDLSFGARSMPLLSLPAAVSVAGAALALAAGGFTAARLAGARRLSDAGICGLLTFASALVVAILALTLHPPALIDRGLGPVATAADALSGAGGPGTTSRGSERAALRAEIRRVVDASGMQGVQANGSDGERGGTSQVLATVLAGIAETADPAAESRAVDAIMAAAGVTRLWPSGA